VHSISYLTGSDKSEGSDSVECSGTSHLVRALPGLADPALDRPDEEALRMFECFSLTPYEVLLPDIAPTRGIHNVSWSIGDRNTRVSIETNGRSSGFIDVPNRDSRVYHD
jgi:hypothetical protein